MAIVRPFRPNLAEMSVYRPFLQRMDVTFYFTGIGLDACRRELDSMGLNDMKAVRYASYPDLIAWGLLRRIIDYKVGLGSYMLTHLHDVLQHDYINIVDPIYAFTFQIARALRRHQKLIVVRWENLHGRYEKIWFAARYASRVLARADTIVCVSKASLRTLQLPPAFSGRVAQVYPGIDLASIREKSGQADIRNESARRRGDPRVILFVGRLQWTKGLETLLVALSILRTHFELPCRLWVVGGGNQTFFRKVTLELGLEGHVEFLGTMSNSETHRKMREADLFSLPSLLSPNWMEQFGFALVEAMAHGLPIVTTDSGSIREICGDAAVYASTGNAYSLAEKIAKALENRGESIAQGEKLRERAFLNFDADRQGTRMLEAIQ